MKTLPLQPTWCDAAAQRRLSLTRSCATRVTAARSDAGELCPGALKTSLGRPATVVLKTVRSVSRDRSNSGLRHVLLLAPSKRQRAAAAAFHPSGTGPSHSSFAGEGNLHQLYTCRRTPMSHGAPTETPARPSASQHGVQHRRLAEPLSRQAVQRDVMRCCAAWVESQVCKHAAHGR